MDDEHQSLLSNDGSTTTAPNNNDDGRRRTIQRNRRGLTTRNRSSSSGQHSQSSSSVEGTKQKKSQHYEDLADSRRKHVLEHHKNSRSSSNRSENNDNFIDSILRQPDTSKSMRGHNLGSMGELYPQYDRYAPPRLVEDNDEFFDLYNAATLSPSVIFAIPCWKNKSQGKTQRQNTLIFMKATVLFVILFATLIAITMTSIAKERSLQRYHIKNNIKSGSSLRYQDGVHLDVSRPEKTIDGDVLTIPTNKTTIGITEKKKISAIRDDTSLDIGYTSTDDMVFDQSRTIGSKEKKKSSQIKETKSLREEDMTDDQPQLTTSQAQNHSNVVDAP